MAARPRRPVAHPRGRVRATRASSRAVAAASALAALAAPASACPSCSLSQGTDTLVFILAFMIVPYAIVSGTWLWIRHILREERR